MLLYQWFTKNKKLANILYIQYSLEEVWCRLYFLGDDFSFADTLNANGYHPCCDGGFVAMGVGRHNSFQCSWGAVYRYVLGAVHLGCILDDVRAVVSCGASVSD